MELLPIIPEIGKEFLSIALLLPLLYFFIKQNKENSDRLYVQMEKLSQVMVDHRKDDSRNLVNIFNAISAHDKQAHEQFENILEKTKKTQLTEEQTISIFKARMWIVSTEDKLPFIEQILRINHIDGRYDQIKDKLKTWLANYSDKYLWDFATYDTPIWNLAKRLADTFDEKEFCKLVKDILDVMYRVDEWTPDVVIDLKIKEIASIMKTLQVWLANRLRKELIANRK